MADIHPTYVAGPADGARQRLIADLGTPGLREAVTLYFDPRQPFAGKTFDSLGRNPPDEITSDDLFAVTLLDVRWPPLAVRFLLADQAPRASELLSMIDSDKDLLDNDADLEQASPMWKLLCDLPGVADTRASKLLARKRSRLIPITDSVVVSAVGTKGTTRATLQYCFRDEQFRRIVTALRPKSAADISLLRVFDVAMWMLKSKSKSAREARKAAGVMSL